MHNIIESLINGIENDLKNSLINYNKSILNNYTNLILKNKKISENTKTNIEKIDGEELQYFNNITIKKIEKYINNIQLKNSNRMLNYLNYMPPRYLGELAEILIEITAMKQKISPYKENVGGHTNVAIITNTNGFIWKEKELYYNPHINPQIFMTNNI